MSKRTRCVPRRHRRNPQESIPLDRRQRLPGLQWVRRLESLPFKRVRRLRCRHNRHKFTQLALHHTVKVILVHMRKDNEIKLRQILDLDSRIDQSLCTHPTGSLIAIHRTATDGEVRESFRRLQLREGQGHGKAFSFMEVEDDPEPDSDVNLADMSLEPRRR